MSVSISAWILYLKVFFMKLSKESTLFSLLIKRFYLVMSEQNCCWCYLHIFRRKRINKLMKFAVTPDIEIHFCKQIFPCVQHFLEMIVFCYHVLSNLLKIYDVFQIMFHEMVSVDCCFKLKLS